MKRVEKYVDAKSNHISLKSDSLVFQSKGH